MDYFTTVHHACLCMEAVNALPFMASPYLGHVSDLSVVRLHPIISPYWLYTFKYITVHIDFILFAN